MKAMWKLLNEFPARREKYVALAETNLSHSHFVDIDGAKTKTVQNEQDYYGMVMSSF